MNCPQCKEQLTAYVEGLLDKAATGLIESHLTDCPQCRVELDEVQSLHGRLLSSGQSVTTVSMDTRVMDRIICEQAEQLRRLKMRKRYRLIGTGGAMAAAVAALVFIVLWSGPTNSRVEAAEFLVKAADAASGLKSVYMKCRMRTLPRDNFSYIGVKRDFVDVEMWKEFGGYRRWRIEKPGRVAVMDGGSTVMYIKGIMAIKIGPTNDAFNTGLLLRLADVDKIITNELHQALRKGSDLKISHENSADGVAKLVVTVETKSGLDDKDLLKNKFLMNTDNRRVYRFDAETKRLEDLKVYVHTADGVVLIIEATEIEYDKEIDPSVFTLELPKDVIWHEEPQPLPDNEKYEKMTPKQATRAFFEACSREDWDEVRKFNTSDWNDRFKKAFGGMEIIKIGEPFQAKRYPGWFIPYEIKLRSGRVKKHNLALKKLKPARRFIVDGGL